jgi:crotonobetainyl-CoA:carnitine CoA-transferase CaiB-like acyl-CoA transferase
MMGQHLADLGAEVVKVEWYKRFDLYRTRGVERLRGSLPEKIRRESSYSFQSLNRNKLGFATDLKSEDGLQLVKDLIRESDILLENFTVGTLDRLGLPPEELNRLNKQLVSISLSATGRGSAIESLRSYGLMLSALGGYESLVTDQDEKFIGSPTFVMSDPNAALFGVFAALAGCLHSRRTGVGATYERSQIEAVASLIQTPRRPEGDSSTIEGIFKTKEDDFVAISVNASADSDIPTRSSEGLETWVGETVTEEVLVRCREAGGEATKVEDLALTEGSEVFAGTDVRQACAHPITGSRDLVATPWRVNGHRSPVRKPAPTLGESNEYILRDALGLTEDEISAVHSSGIVDED